MIIYLYYFLFALFLLLYLAWSVVITFLVSWLYLKSLFLFLINIIGINFRRKIKKEIFEAIFNTPLLTYPFIVFNSIMVFMFVQENIIKYVDKMLYKKMYYNEPIVMYSAPVISIIILYLGIILFYSYYYEENAQKNIIDAFKRHKRFLKILFIPTALIGVVVPLISVANIIFEENTKKELLRELTNFSISSNMLSFIFIIVVTLIYSAIGNFILNILIHVVEEIKYYSYFVMTTKNFFVQISGINKKKDSAIRKPPIDEE